MKRSVAVIPLMLVHCLFAVPESNDVAVKTVNAKGLGGTAEEALNEAYKDAIQQAVGVYVDSEFAMCNDEIIKDQVLTHSNAYIDRYEKIGDLKRTESGVQVNIRAWVKVRDFARKIQGLAKGGAVSTDGASLSASRETQEWRDNRGAEILRKELEGLDPIRMMMDVTMSGRKPEIVRKDDRTVTVRYFYDLAYDKNLYLNVFVPRMEQVLGQISTSKPKVLRLSLPHGDVNARYVSLSCKVSTGFRVLQGQMNAMRSNPICQIRALCMPNYLGDYEATRQRDARMGARGKEIPYVDLVTKASQSGMLTIKRYELPAELVRIYTDWCRGYKKKSRDVKFLVRLLDAEGESLAEQEMPVYYAGVFNCPQDQGYGDFEVIACEEVRLNCSGSTDLFQVVFSPFFNVPPGVLADHLPCYVDVPIARSDLKNVVKAEIRLSELVE